MGIKKVSDNHIKNFLKRLDFFSVTFQFRVDSKKKYQSCFGGFFFMLYLIAIVSYILKSFFDYISFSDFKIQYIDRYEDQTKIQITEKRFFYSFKFTFEELSSNAPTGSDLDFDVFNSKYKDLFIIEHNYVLKNIQTGSSTKIKTPVQTCNLTNIKSFDSRIPQNATTYDFYKNHICFKYQDYAIYGLYTDKIMSYIEVTLKLNNTYYNNHLSSLKDIFEKVNFKFNPYYSDYIYDVSNLTIAVTTRIESTVYSYVDIDYFERTNIFLNELTYIEDHNLFFKEKVYNTYVKYANFDRSLYPIKGRFDNTMSYSDKLNLIKYYIRPNMNKSEILITLIKIPEFLSGISAISTSTLIILNLIISYFNLLKAKQKIVQKIMKYNDIIKEKNKDYFDYFLRNLKEKKFDLKELSIKNNNVLAKSKNKIFVKNSNLVSKKQEGTGEHFLRSINPININCSSNTNNMSSNYDCNDNFIFKNMKKFKYSINNMLTNAEKFSEINKSLSDAKKENFNFIDKQEYKSQDHKTESLENSINHKITITPPYMNYNYEDNHNQRRDDSIINKSIPDAVYEQENIEIKNQNQKRFSFRSRNFNMNYNINFLNDRTNESIRLNSKSLGKSKLRSANDIIVIEKIDNNSNNDKINSSMQIEKKNNQSDLVSNNSYDIDKLKDRDNNYKQRLFMNNNITKIPLSPKANVSNNEILIIDNKNKNTNYHQSKIIEPLDKPFEEKILENEHAQNSGIIGNAIGINYNASNNVDADNNIYPKKSKKNNEKITFKSSRSLHKSQGFSNSESYINLIGLRDTLNTNVKYELQKENASIIPNNLQNSNNLNAKQTHINNNDNISINNNNNGNNKLIENLLNASKFDWNNSSVNNKAGLRKKSNNCNKNNAFLKCQPENIIFDSFGKKIRQNFEKNNNIKYKNPLKLTCCELFFKCLISRNIKKKRLVFNIAEEKFNYNLDILTYLKRMLEIDILKYLILDKNLLNIMNFISKPSVSYNTKEKVLDPENDINLFFDSCIEEKQIDMGLIKDSFDNILSGREKVQNHNKYKVLEIYKYKNHTSNTNSISACDNISLNSIERRMLQLLKHQIEEINN